MWRAKQKQSKGNLQSTDTEKIENGQSLICEKNYDLSFIKKGEVPKF